MTNTETLHEMLAKADKLRVLVSGLPHTLEFVLKYLEHPDVQAMNFALPASNPARMLREIKRIQYFMDET